MHFQTHIMRNNFGHLMKVFVTGLAILLAAITQRARAQNPLPAATVAPGLRHTTSGDRRDHGLWDDIVPVYGRNLLLLSRDSTLWSLSISGPSKLEKLAASPWLAGSSIVTCAESGKKLWVFVNARDRGPFAIDAHSGETTEFPIAGLNISAHEKPVIESHVIVRNADAIVLMISGGDQATWPRDGNRPLYFWMSLRSGTVVEFPIGWDLDYFSEDQTIAVFGADLDKETFRRRLQAVDVRTGGPVADVPDQRKAAFIPFNWPDTEPLKWLFSRREGPADIDDFAGLSENGVVRLFDLKLGRRTTLKEADGFVGFRSQPDNGYYAAPGPFWISPISPGQTPKLVAREVLDFMMFGGGSAVYSSADRLSNGPSSEVFYHDYQNGTQWNVLDGVERLPPLDHEFMLRDSVKEEMSARFIGSSGNNVHARAILCLFTHYRRDDDGSPSTKTNKVFESQMWHRTVLVASSGQRYLTDLFRENEQPDEVWFHPSGTVMASNQVWISGERKKRLFESSLKLSE